MKGAVPQCHSHDHREAQTDFSCRLVVVDLLSRSAHEFLLKHMRWTHKIDLNLLYRARPAIEAKNLICKIDAFICSLFSQALVR